MIARIIRYFYPDIQENEIKKFSLLSIAFSLAIGAYWMLRLLKVTIFYSIAFVGDMGRILEPTAKTCSVLIIFCAVLIYSKLVDNYKKEKLFWIICGFYTILFSAIAGTLFIYEIFGRDAIGETYMHLFGWVSYFTVESFGSVVVALFWSYTASITDTTSAKRGYPFIIASAQFAAICGSLLSVFAPTCTNNCLWPILLLATIYVVSIPIIITKIESIDNNKTERHDASLEKNSKKTSALSNIFKGITLIVTRPYLFGIFVISTFYEIVSIIIEYQMKSQAHALYGKVPAHMLKFFGVFGTVTNSLAFIMALMGTSYLLRQYGLRFCLLVYPCVLFCSIASLYTYYSYGSPSTQELLWATFFVVAIAKALSYAVNNPTKEMMYIPTSKDAKFKAKGFIDMFGSRSAKLVGSRVNHIFKHDLSTLMTYGTAMGFGLIGFWLVAALFVGIKNAQLIRNNKIVE